MVGFRIGFVPVKVDIGLAEAQALAPAFTGVFKAFVEKKVKDHALANIS